MKTLSLKKFISVILPTVLALLGFSGCSSDDDGDNYPVEYGTLAPRFEVKGKVVQKEDATLAIQGIRVVSYPIYEEGERKELADTLFTEEDGTFFLTKIRDSYQKVILEDIDGEENGGTFKKQIIEIKFENMDKEDIIYDQQRLSYQYQITVEMEKEKE